MVLSGPGLMSVCMTEGNRDHKSAIKRETHTGRRGVTWTRSKGSGSGTRYD